MKTATLLIRILYAFCLLTTHLANADTLHMVGLDFSPYLDGQSPNLGTQISEAQLRSRMQVIAADTEWIRTYGTENGLEKAGAIAHSLNLKAAIGAFLSRDPVANEAEITNLISIGQRGEADLVIVGSEVLQRGDLTTVQLIGFINRVRQALPGKTVTTADTFNALLANPSVIAACDKVLMNYYPYFSGVGIDQAIADMQDKYQQVRAASGSKEVIISETGWPSAGSAIGSAVPSQDNANRYMREFVTWANTTQTNYFYFEAFDEAWKATAQQPQESHWGIRDTTGAYKLGADSVFKLQITRVPSYGNAGDLGGVVGLPYRTSAYKVSIYIQVNGLWYTKPYLAAPLTDIQADGNWYNHVVTGGNDQDATRLVAFLIPASYTPPLASDASTLPAELDQNAIARAEVTRNPVSIIPSLYYITLDPAIIFGGDSVTGTINLSYNAPVGGFTVSLSSSNAIASVPAVVIVPSGSPTAKFTVMTTTVTTEQSIMITATSNGNSIRTIIVKPQTVTVKGGTKIFDVNGDGKADLLWQNNTTGQLYYWTMDGLTQTGGDFLVTTNYPDWKLVGTPDLNNDGHADLLWQNKNDGTLYYWLMNGTASLSRNYLSTTVYTDWQVVSTPDLNGDGKSDLLWQNKTDGTLYYWLMDGLNVISRDYLTSTPYPDWKVVATADFNGDSKPDLLWQNKNDGTLYYWFLNGTNVIGRDYLTTTPYPDWEVVAAPDLNNDGKPDLLWRNKNMGQVYYWLLSGVTTIGRDFLTPTAYPDWRIVSPH